MKRNLPYLLLMAAVILLDQATKALVARFMDLHEYVPIVSGLLSLSHVRNRGAAFGLLADWDVPYQSVVLAVLSCLALGAIAFYFLRLPATARLPRLALALVLGGAAGNLIDRLRLGHVVDYVAIGSWPTFNVADVAIAVGAVLLVLRMLTAPPTVEGADP